MWKSIKVRTRVVLAALTLSAVLATSQQSSSNGSVELTSSLKELQKIGIKVRDAVLSKDIETLLSFDRPDVREIDRARLKDTSSDLYCMMFDTKCITWGHRSVYDILRTARELRIEAQDLGKGPEGS
jgi:hypothetical protein